MSDTMTMRQNAINWFEIPCEDLDRAAPLVGALRHAARVGGVGHRTERREDVVAEAPGHVAAAPANGVEELALASAAGGRALDGDRPQVVDGHRRLAGERLHRATVASRGVLGTRAARARDGPHDGTRQRGSDGARGRFHSRHFSKVSALGAFIAQSNSDWLTCELQFLKASSPMASRFSWSWNERT